MDRAEHVRQILCAKGLTLYRVSQKSAEVFGRSSRFYVPHNLRYDVSNPALVPTIHQLLAFSHATNYRLSDWLAVFGIDLDLISSLRAVVPRKQTTLLDSTIYNTDVWIPWFVARQHDATPPPVAPLRQLLASAEPRRAMDLVALNKSTFIYARVGEADVYARSHFAAGSIVRVDPRRSHGPLPELKTSAGKLFFLIEHDFGWNCSRLSWLAKDRIVLRSSQSACAQQELRLGQEARILGVVDAEIRPIRNQHNSGLLPPPVILKSPRLVPLVRPQTNLKDLLRNSRIKLGLGFREASSVSRWIANRLSDELYFAAPSTLSDYETLAQPPRHVQKMLTLCLLYSIDFLDFLRVSGLPLDQQGHDPMPDELARRNVPRHGQGFHLAKEHEGSEKSEGLLSSLVSQWEETPLFLRHTLEELTGIKNFSLSDIFWVGGDRAPIHPLLIDATLVAVNRRIKNPVPAQGNAPCRRPIYLILKRDGSLLCGSCILRDGTLVVEGDPGSPFGRQHFRKGVDAEVIGQVTAVLRRLG